MYRGPTQVMRGEHVQMRQLLAAAETALAEGTPTTTWVTPRHS
jgi:hypothetical protein